MLNTHVKDNFTELRAGGIAIASQADKDFLFASSSTQIGRLAAVANRVPRFNGSAWEMFNLGTQNAWPVGSIFESGVATNPNTLLGFGTWTAHGTGRILVAIDAGQPEFDAVNETGGAKTHTLNEAEMAPHTHTQNAHTHTQNSHSHTLSNLGNTIDLDIGGVTSLDTTGSRTSSSATATNQNATATNNAAGSGNAHQNCQPYIVIHRWKRDA